MRKNASLTFTWCGFVKSAPLLAKGTCRSIGNRTRTNFWQEPWLGSTPLCEVTLSGIPKLKVTNMLKSSNTRIMVEVGTGTDLEGYYHSAGLLSNNEDDDDDLCWAPEQSGKFSICFAYI